MSRSGSRIGQNTKVTNSVLETARENEEGLEMRGLPVRRCWTGRSFGTPPLS